MLLDIQDLAVSFGEHDVVSSVSLSLKPGEIMAIVGESGSGKSLTALSILRLLPPKARAQGRILFEGEEVSAMPPERLLRLRGGDIGMIFQEPLSALNPLHRVGRQVMEALMAHSPRPLSAQACHDRSADLLESMGLRTKMHAYPHELSGGQRQRVVVAIALANTPRLLIADEPTTALDVTIQAEVLALLRAIHQRMGMGILFITHDLDLVQHFADSVAIMEQGHLVEMGPTRDVFAQPRTPATRQLLDARLSPRTPDSPPLPPPSPASQPVLDAQDLRVHFPVRRGLLRRTHSVIKAVDGVSFTLHPGRTIGIIGESGSGKTSLALAALQLRPCSGTLRLKNTPITPQQRAWLRTMMHIVFQDPFSSLSPRMCVLDIVAEGLAILEPKLTRQERIQRVQEILYAVGLQTSPADTSLLYRYPHAFSGGQRQRIAIARALILKPQILVLDEPTSALDRTVQKQVIELLLQIQKERNLAYMIISHDLQVIRAMADDVVVMHNGTVVEQGSAAFICEHPQTPYTQALIHAALHYAPG